MGELAYSVLGDLNIVKMEPITIGELLTFLSSIILLLITWKSVSNAKKANENAAKANHITEQSQLLQRDQFHLSIKPDLIFSIPPIKYTEEENDKDKVFQLIWPDHSYAIENVSSNICYNITVTTIVYMPNDGWEKYYAFPSRKHRPNTVNSESLHSLYTVNQLDCSIPFVFSTLNIISYDGTVPQPEIYTFIRYEDKTQKVYEECFNLKSRGKVFGRRNKPDDIEIHFDAKKVDLERTKKKVDEQKNKLNNDFPDKHRLFYPIKFSS
ncbi:hypothetical protein BpOF4_21864 (plasmid) [Alkalihalophilus pseudofirmus OF4]|uniref:Uncharacterized protein n=1 Tax=Alkalihalophilus pseudofirmus (strain ATCC BAA-2126 / JCM 17055 / OF4) TaxID=398511 RepID=D3G1Z2_ALKPO|nr:MULTISPECIES: hypothetical protein [Alkalihalophilus]ADC52368.1 hypothetical protein BpOF4_21864 [Alkalihalophilus pseudofirmus OF4]MED1603673.1 hypothetical protein [Alkalihalophilus marmarensis]